ncbi:MAG: TOBE domain-containing protein, partial [Proteobacteria bacterium]|nr:TOBE domain-containing protein [Pseudomonadota bacterium]
GTGIIAGGPMRAIFEVVGESVLLARITKRSVDALGLYPGLPVWAQVKSVAVAQ